MVERPPSPNPRQPRWLFAVLIALVPTLARADLTLLVQPSSNEEHIRASFSPLAAYLSKVTGQRIKLETPPNYFTFWQWLTEKKIPDIVIESASFVDLDLDRGYRFLARSTQASGLALIVRANSKAKTAADLTGQPIACADFPSTESVALAAIFDNPIRAPRIVDTREPMDRIDRLVHHEVAAAVVPVTAVIHNGKLDPRVRALLVTPPTPGKAILAAPTIPQSVVEQLRVALVNGFSTPEGAHAILATGLSPLSPSGIDLYAAQGRALRYYLRQ